MKHQALFSSKDKSKKLKCCLLQFLLGTLRVKKNLGVFHISVTCIHRLLKSDAHVMFCKHFLHACSGVKSDNQKTSPNSKVKKFVTQN